MDNYMFIDYLFKKSESVVMPDTQYRMSTEISKMISKLFYEGKPHNGSNPSTQQPLPYMSMVLDKHLYV